MKTINLLLIIIFVVSCASTNRTKTLLTMGLTGAGGATTGAISTPKNENPTAHALLWGGICATISAVLSLFIFDEEKRSEMLSQENDTLKKALNALNGNGDLKEPQLLFESSATFGKEIPNEYRNLVRPGRWSIYQLNQWILQGENTLVHQDKMIRLLPPEFNPNINNQEKEEK